MFVDPGVALQPLPADSHHLGPLQQAHLQLKRHGHLPEVALGPTLEGIPLTKEVGDDSRLDSRTDMGTRRPFTLSV